MKNRITFIPFLTVILTLAAGSAFGTYSGGSGDWKTATNWSPEIVPNNGTDTFAVKAGFDIIVELKGLVA